MAPSPVNTGSSQTARALLEQALTKPEGITIHFPFAKYNGEANARTALKSLQVALYNARARANRLVAAAKGELDNIDRLARGPFDSLSFVKTEDALGVHLGIVPSDSLMAGLDVTDNATGDSLQGETQEIQRIGLLIKAWTSSAPMSDEDFAYLRRKLAEPGPDGEPGLDLQDWPGRTTSPPAPAAPPAKYLSAMSPAEVAAMLGEPLAEPPPPS